MTYPEAGLVTSLNNPVHKFNDPRQVAPWDTFTRTHHAWRHQDKQVFVVEYYHL